MLSADTDRAASLAPRVTFGIVTALEEERAAVLAMLEGPVRYDARGKGAGLVYDLGEIPAPDGGTHVVALALAGMGNTIAAARGTLLLQHFDKVEAVLMVGIAGGVPWPEKPEDHVRLGDVVVSDARGVVQFDFVKKTQRNVEHRQPPRPPCARLLESAVLLASNERLGKRPWEAHLGRGARVEGAARPAANTDVLVSTGGEEVVHPVDPRRREGMPRIFRGVIGSSGTLLKDPQERDRLRAVLGVRAVEMEGAGIADATWSHGVGFLVVRGICDYCDRNKGDAWHGYAAVVAAAYTRALLEATAVSGGPPRRRTKGARQERGAPQAPSLLKAKPKAAAQVPHNLPPRRVFVGREAELAALGEALRRGSWATIGQASLYGLGGVGKSALALEYAWRSLGSYPGGVFWVAAEGRPVEAMARLGVALRLYGPAGVREAMPAEVGAALAEAARAALQGAGKAALVVLDNVSEAGFGDRVPASPVQVLVTTRDERLALGEAALLEVLSAEDAVRLGEKLGGAGVGEEDRRARERVLVEELGGLAVAVEVAALSVKRWAGSWKRYEGDLRARAKELMGALEAGSPYPLSVTAALDLSLDRCEAGSEAQRLLQGMAVFAPEGVPMEWAEAAARLDGDSVEARRARSVLKGLGLASVDAERETLSMHRLVHARVRERVRERKPLSWVERWVPWAAGRAVRKVEAAWEEGWLMACRRGVECVADCLVATVGVERERRGEVEALRPHVWEVLEAAKRMGRDREWVVIAMKMAEHTWHCAAYEKARELFAEALEMAEDLHPAEPGLVSWCLDGLASVLLDLGKAGEALPLFDRALAIDEETYGPDHPKVATDVSNLALALLDLGKAVEAQSLLVRALAIDEKNHGPDHSRVAIRLSNLACVLKDLGKAGEARPLLERALAIDETTYGPNHPNVATRLSNLAGVLRDLGKAGEAQPLQERALAIDETTYGPNHPLVANRLSNLALALLDLGKAGEARPLLERALAIDETTYGPNHPNVAIRLASLAGVLRDLGKAGEARPLLERALAIDETTYGPDHPEVGNDLSKLGNVLLDLGQAPAARPLLERALALHDAAYGPSHPRVAQDLSRLGIALHALGQPADARPLLERALALHETLNSPTHPDTLCARARLDAVLRTLAAS